MNLAVLLDLISELHRLSGARHQCDFAELERTLLRLERELHDAFRHCHHHHHPDDRPASITVTTLGDIVSFAPGQTITFTAASENAEQQPVADTYTWTTTAGTIVDGADSNTVTISDAPLGDLTVTATDPAGLSGSVTVTVADQTPASVTVTAS